MSRFFLSTHGYRRPVTVVIMCAVSLTTVAAFGGCGGGSRGTGSYGVGGVRPAFVNEQPPKKPKRASSKSRAKAIVTPTPTPSN